MVHEVVQFGHEFEGNVVHTANIFNKLRSKLISSKVSAFLKSTHLLVDGIYC